ncbi:MAG: hypothetical protein JOZ15_01670 [Acidobacteria bacterium]|nr:hypothetical protein [Acidobacteriota bacterium]
MELSKKTTLLFPPDFHRELTRLARQQRLSLGELVRRACEAQYGIVSKESRLEAVRDLEALSLPVGDPEQIEKESVPGPEELLP